MIIQPRSLALVILVGALIGCGGSSEFSTPDTHSAAEPENYRGNTHPALLTTNNAMVYADALFNMDELSAYPNPASRKYDSQSVQRPGIMNLPAFLDGLNQSTNEQWQQRTTQYTCANTGEGSYQRTESTSADVYPKITTHQFSNCQMANNGSFVSGQIELIEETRQKNLQPTLSRMNFSNLQITHNNAAYIYSGSQQYELSNIDHLAEWQIITNLSERNVQTNKVNLIRDLKRTIPGSGYAKLAGYFYDHDHGYIRLQASDDLESSMDEILIRGQIFMLGASQSKAAIQFKESWGGRQYTVKLDHDGDGQYEAVALTNIDMGESSDFNHEFGPVAIIAWRYFAAEEPVLTVGQSIHLDASNCFDIDSTLDQLDLVWTVEEKPIGSELALDFPNNQDLYFYLDKPGNYQISLKVTDKDGHTDLTVKNFHVLDQAPEIRFSFENSDNQLEIGEPTQINVNILDHEDDWEATQQYSYVWTLQTPEGSHSQLTDAHREGAFIQADLPGIYKISYQTTDAAGNTTETSLELNAVNTAPTAIINRYATVGSDGIEANTTIRLNGSASHDPGFTSSDLSYSWAIVSAPTGSQAQITESTEQNNTELVEWEEAKFTPDLAGEYRIALTVTDNLGLSHTSYDDFTVVN